MRIHLDRTLAAVATLLGVVALAFGSPGDIQIATVALIAAVVSHA